MSFPAMPGGAGGGDIAGMSEQEAAMVKAVSRSFHVIFSQDVADCLSMVDAKSHGKLSLQERYVGGNGFRSWRSFWFVYVKRTCAKAEEYVSV